MTASDSVETQQAPTAPDSFNTLRRLLSGRRGMLVLAGLALALGLVFKWNWLVAAGIAPLVPGLLSCTAMCALGAGCAYMATTHRSGPKPPVAGAQPDLPPESNG